jgi:4'-phosphopantetheinyl transferase
MPMDRLVIPAPGIKVGFWKITESLEILQQMYNGNGFLEHPEQMVPAKHIHSLAGRLLAQHFYPEDEIVKDEFGKPHLKKSKPYISWSHSGNYAAFITSENGPTGIDIEMVSNRIRRIEDKFCNKSDKDCIYKTHHTESLLLIWAAKESLYKLYGRKEVDFKKEMTIEAFDLSHEGRFTAHFHKGDMNEKYTMEYEFFDGYVAVWTLDKEQQHQLRTR